MGGVCGVVCFCGSTTEEEGEQSESGDEGILRTICTISDRLACPKAEELSSEYANFVLHAKPT